MDNNIRKLDELFSSESNETRLIKARRVLQIISNQGVVFGKARCLEIGTGSGIMSAFFSDQFAEFISIDKFDIRKSRVHDFTFRLMSSDKLAFPDGSFDVIIFSHVYQYLPEKMPTLQEIRRVMKTSGVCYFSTSNRFAPLEPHYQLPLLGYFPRMLASSYLRLFSPKYTEYDIYSESYMRLSRTLSREFDARDITVELVKNYRNYEFSEIPVMKIIGAMPRFILKLINCSIITNWIFVLRIKH